MRPIITSLPVGGADTRQCSRCNQLTFWVATEVPLYSSSGYRVIRILLCENHPAPSSIAENKDGTYTWAVPE